MRPSRRRPEVMKNRSAGYPGGDVRPLRSRWARKPGSTRRSQTHLRNRGSGFWQRPEGRRFNTMPGARCGVPGALPPRSPRTGRRRAMKKPPAPCACGARAPAQASLARAARASPRPSRTSTMLSKPVRPKIDPDGLRHPAHHEAQPALLQVPGQGQNGAQARTADVGQVPAVQDQVPFVAGHNDVQVFGRGQGRGAVHAAVHGHDHRVDRGVDKFGVEGHGHGLQTPMGVGECAFP